MKINSQEILLLNKNMKFGEAPTAPTSQETTETTVSKPESTLNALDLQGKNNIAFQGANASLLQKLRQLPKAAILAGGLALTTPIITTSCAEQEQHVEVDVTALVAIMQEFCDKMDKLIERFDLSIEIQREIRNSVLGIRDDLQKLYDQGRITQEQIKTFQDIYVQKQDETLSQLQANGATEEEIADTNKAMKETVDKILEKFENNEISWQKALDLLKSIDANVGNIYNEIKALREDMNARLDSLYEVGKLTLAESKAIKATIESGTEDIVAELKANGKTDKEILAVTKQLRAQMNAVLTKLAKGEIKFAQAMKEIMELLNSINNSLGDILAEIQALRDDMNTRLDSLYEVGKLDLAETKALKATIESGTEDIVAQLRANGKTDKEILAVTKQLRAQMNAVLTKLAKGEIKFAQAMKEIMELLNSINNSLGDILAEIQALRDDMNEGLDSLYQVGKLTLAEMQSFKTSVEARTDKIVDELRANGKTEEEILAITKNIRSQLNVIITKLTRGEINFAKAMYEITKLLSNIDNSVKEGLEEVVNHIDDLGAEQQEMLTSILEAINLNNNLSADNNKMLSIIIKQLAKLDRNDSHSMAILNRIWMTIEKSIKAEKEMDRKEMALLQSILENIQNFNADTKENLLLLIESVKNLDSSVANSFAKLFNKIDNIGNDGQKLLNEILNEVIKGNNMNAKQTELLASILDAMSNIDIDNNPEIADLLNKIWDAIQADIKQDHAMNEKTHSLLHEILDSIKNFNAETTTLLKEILAKSDKLGEEQIRLLNVIIKNQEKLSAQGKDSTNKILEAINNNTEVAKGTHVLVAEILGKMDKLGNKADKIIDAIANISVGEKVDLSTIESMLADILAQEKANGDLLTSADAKASLVLVSLEGIKNAIKDGNKAIIDKIQEVIDNMPESCKCDAKLDEIIKQLQKIIDNARNDESIEGDLGDLEDMFK